jgi:hypothetical protein
MGSLPDTQEGRDEGHVSSAASSDPCYCETDDGEWRPCPPSLCERIDEFHKHPKAAEVKPAANLRELLVELAQWSRVAERNGDLHTRIAAALALDEERRELGRDASAAGEDGAAQ